MQISKVILGRLSGLRIERPLPRSGALHAISPVESRVEPLGGVGRYHLIPEHEEEFVIESLGVLDGEMSELEAPIGPATRQPMENLARRSFMSSFENLGNTTLETLRDPGLRNPLKLFKSGHVRFSCIHLDQKIRRSFSPRFWKVKHDRSVGLPELRLDPTGDILRHLSSEHAFDLHLSPE
jgi:hypothetical protein